VSIGSRLKDAVGGSGGSRGQSAAEDVGSEETESDEDVVLEDDEDMDTGSLRRVEVGFENVRMTLRQKKGSGDRVILDGSIRGKAQSGRMLAIMGPSGSGKSTLVQAIAGQIKESSKLTLSGSRFINGEFIAGDSQLPSAFIEQEVNFFPHMTLKETLDFRVELRLGKKLGRKARDDVVASLMEQLGLTKSANTIVGNSKVRGISGGERKRLSIACEMISSPPVIFLDEPTSGLDSYQAAQVVQTLRNLADSGKTVIAVIHQPSQHVFGLFDDLLLISEGKLMYYGAVTKVRGYLEGLGYGCEKEMGTAEHVLECISRVNGGGPDEEASIERIEHLARDAKARASDILIENGRDSLVSAGKKKRKRKHLKTAHYRGASLLRQFKLLLTRAFAEVVRSKGTIIIKIVQQVSIAAIYGGIYKLGNNQGSIMDRIGLLSLIVIGATNMATAGTIRAFPKEKAIVSGELANKLYSTLPYFMAKAISEIPLIGFFQGIFGVIIYPLTGLQKSKFKNFLALTTLHTIVAEAGGLLIGALSPSSDVALALFPAVIVLNIIFDGKNISEENIPRFLRWLPKISLVRWGFEGLAVNDFEGLTFETSGPPRGPVAKTGMQALERFGLGSRTVQDVMLAQRNIILGCWFLSWLGLSLTKQKYQVMGDPSKVRLDSKNGTSR